MPGSVTIESTSRSTSLGRRSTRSWRSIDVRIVWACVGGGQFDNAAAVASSPYSVARGGGMEALMIGVSGMRGTIGGTLTPPVVSRMAAAFAQWLKIHQAPKDGR